LLINQELHSIQTTVIPTPASKVEGPCSAVPPSTAVAWFYWFRWT